MKLDAETVELLDKASVHSTYKETLIFGLWDIFQPKKRDAMIRHLRDGMSWHSAFEYAKKGK